MQEEQWGKFSSILFSPNLSITIAPQQWQVASLDPWHRDENPTGLSRDSGVMLAPNGH